MKAPNLLEQCRILVDRTLGARLAHAAYPLAETPNAAHIAVTRWTA
jgi:hypothetical protein